MTKIQTIPKSGHIIVEGIEYEYSATLFRRIHQLDSDADCTEWQFGNYSTLSFLGRQPPDGLVDIIQAEIAASVDMRQ